MVGVRERRTGGHWYRGLFNPLGLSGLQLWLDASVITGLADADPVGTWSDLSGNGNNATQATAAAKPLYKVNILNGRPVVRFDGTDDKMTGSHGAIALPWTMIVAIRNWVAPALRARVLHGDSNNSIGSNTTNWEFNADGDLIVGPVASTSPTILVGIIESDPRQRLFVNGALEATKLDGTPASLTGNYVLGTGGGIGGTNFFNGDIAEVIVYNRALSTAERQQVEQYLSVKYGIALG